MVFETCSSFDLGLKDSHSPSRFCWGQDHDVACVHPLHRQHIVMLEDLFIVFDIVDQLNREPVR